MISAILLVALLCAEDQGLAIRCGALIDGKSDTALKNAVVLVRGKRIESVGRNLAIPEGYQLMAPSRLRPFLASPLLSRRPSVSQW